MATHHEIGKEKLNVITNLRLKLVALSISSLLIIFSAHAESEFLNLNDLINEALSQNPKLKEMSAETKAAANIPSRVGSLPDPMLQLTAQNFRTDDFKYDSSPMSAVGIGLIQEIPFPGKLSRKNQVASDHAKTLSEKERLMKALVIFQVTQAYWNLHFAERSLSITEENIKVVDVLADVAINRLKVAKVAQQDVFQAQVADSKLRSKLAKRKEMFENAKRNLNNIIGKDSESKIDKTISPPLREVNFVKSDIFEEMNKFSPYIKVTNLKVAKNISALSEAKYDRFPNLKLGINYNVRGMVPGDKTNGADMVSVFVGISLPLWMGSKQNARVSESINNLAAAKAQEIDVILEISSRVNILLEKIASLNTQIKLYKKEVLPRADKALDASISDYKSAKVGFVSVVQNWQAELDLQISYEELLKERAIVFSEIELVTGLSLRRLKL